MLCAVRRFKTKIDFVLKGRRYRHLNTGLSPRNFIGIVNVFISVLSFTVNTPYVQLLSPSHGFIREAWNEYLTVLYRQNVRWRFLAYSMLSVPVLPLRAC